jgi:hypothetical protein
LPAYSTSEAPPEREVGGLQTRPFRQFHRCKSFLTLPCQKFFHPATVTFIAYGIHAIALAVIVRKTPTPYRLTNPLAQRRRANGDWKTEASMVVLRVEHRAEPNKYFLEEYILPRAA